MLTTPLDKQEAGALLRKRREALGLTQDQVAEQAGIPTITQLSEYENGKVSIARSKYLSKLVSVLRLSNEDIKAINPAAVIEVAAPEPSPTFDPRALFHPKAKQRQQKRDLWPNLAAMIEEKQEKHPPLRETRWQQHLNQTRFSGGQEPDAEGWFEMYQAMRRNNVEPEEWSDD